MTNFKEFLKQNDDKIRRAASANTVLNYNVAAVIKKDCMDVKYGEIWFAKIPSEVDVNKTISGIVIVLDSETFQVLVAKVSKVSDMKYDYFDLPILYWQECNLKFESSARMSQTLYLPRTAFTFKIGELLEYDLKAIQEPFRRLINSKE